jgi:hypothetical protein
VGGPGKEDGVGGVGQTLRFCLSECPSVVTWWGGGGGGRKRRRIAYHELFCGGVCLRTFQSLTSQQALRKHVFEQEQASILKVLYVVSFSW